LHSEIFQNINKMKQIKILGTGCAKCKTTYNKVMEAIKQSGVEAEVLKIEDIEEIMKYNVLSTPAILIDDVLKIKGRVADVSEIKQLLAN
jgi:small redox-active disulfide protein 2